MVDKNLFLYDLAIVAIFKDEARYLKEWLDYHLLAGVEHFYLYNNDSTDDYKEVLAPYVEKNLVTLTEYPGKMMQYPAYDDAIDKYRFECRYMAFIDLDEFIYPKTNQSISEVVDEILSPIPQAAGLGINWQIFGSNGQEAADYSRGVLERFTRRAKSDWISSTRGGNLFKKVIDNPRLIRYRINPHFSVYFGGKAAVNTNGEFISLWYGNEPILSDKIVINHYHIKSKEEFSLKQSKGRATGNTQGLPMEVFYKNDRNEEFDDGILKYRAARTKKSFHEDNNTRASRVVNTLIQTLTQCSPSNAPAEFFTDKLETFLTCRAVAEKFDIKIGERSAEEYALAWIYLTLINAKPIPRAEAELFLRALPEILSRPFPICRKIRDFALNIIIPSLCEVLKSGNVESSADDWMARADWLYIQKLLRLV